jgi:hypothetical protein
VLEGTIRGAEAGVKRSLPLHPTPAAPRQRPLRAAAPPEARAPVLAIGLRRPVAGRLTGPPWTAAVDLGQALLPHRLEARGLAADGGEVARIEQWVNLPRPQAEVEIVLEDGGAGKPSAARLHWESRTGETPSEVRLSLDGAPLPLDGRARVTLPAPAAGSAHLLSAELRFAHGVTAREDVALTGDWASDVATELTAVAVETEEPRGALAEKELTGRFVAGGRALRVAAVEREPPQVFVVRAPGVEVDVRYRLSSLARGLVGSGRRKDGRDILFHGVAAAPTFHRTASATAEIFDVSSDRALAGVGLGGLLLAGRSKTELFDRPRLADATAVAGLHAHARHAPRAVLLVLRGGEAADLSHLEPAAVRGYLAALGVPLFVWSIDGRGSAAWGEVEDVSTPLGMHAAYARFERELERQQIVWLEGRWLPQEIALSPAAGTRSDLALVSSAAASPARSRR